MEIIYIDGFKYYRYPIFIRIMVDYKEKVLLLD